MLSSAGHMSPAAAHTHGHGHTHTHTHHAHSSISALQLTKPSPLSSADNAPRSLHLNAVQAVNTHYHTPTSYTHKPPTLTAASRSQSYIAPSTTNSSSTATLTLTSAATAAAATGHKLRRMPAGANLAEYRQQYPHLRSQSLNSIPSKSSSNSHNNGGSSIATSSPSSANIAAVTAAMSSINAIAAGPGPNNTPPAGHPPHGGRFDSGPRSPPSEFSKTSIRNSIQFNATQSVPRCRAPDSVNASAAHPTSPMRHAWLHQALTLHLTHTSPLWLPWNMLCKSDFTDNVSLCFVPIGSC